ncbi:hypothetical protein [Corynebacterium sp.]|uniref:hypothetical protein n=1 Tax=Corynebacterium sp. TaxID=1720 RepID=UPI0028AE3226|nr:hypothetical protein [Corynebacterium sp.]
MTLIALVCGFINALFWNGRQQPDDWSSLWIAGTLANQGDKEHIYDHDTSVAPHPYVHIPGLAELISPLTTLMDFDASVTGLTFISGLCLPILISASWALWAKTSIPFLVLVPATVAGWFLSAFQTGSWLGQTTPLILCLTICSIAVLVPLISGGAQLFGTWIDTLTRMSSETIVTGTNRSFASILSLNDAADRDGVAPVVTDTPTITSIYPVVVFVVLFAGAVLAARLNRNHSAGIVLLGAYTAATISSGLMWNYYALVCIPVIFGSLILGFTLEHRGSTATVIAVSTFTLLLYPPLNDQVTSRHLNAGIALPWADLTALLGLSITLITVVIAARNPTPTGRHSATGTTGEHSSRGQAAPSLSRQPT